MPYEMPLDPVHLWAGKAKCQGTGVPDTWYPDKKTETYADTVRKSQAVCRGQDGRPPCPVLLECLAWALINEEKFGVWGGLSTRERNALRRKKDLSRYKVVTLIGPSPYKQMIQTYLEGSNATEEDSEKDDLDTE